MKTIPTKPKLQLLGPDSGNSVMRIFLLIIFTISLFNSDVKSQCILPSGFMEVGSNVGDDVDDLSEIVSYNSHKFLVRGKLNIDFSWSLKGYEFIMDPNAELITKGQIYFSLINCSFKGCNALWKGIVLNSSVTFFMNDCVISDALNAVYIGPSGSGSDLSINTSYFFNNSVGIRTSGILNGVFSVTYCKFFGTENGLLNGNTPLAGIYLNHSAPGFYADGNLFQGLQNGITCLSDVYNLTQNNVYKNIINDSGVSSDNPLGSGAGSAVRILGGYNIKKPVVKVTGNTNAIYDVGPQHEFFKDNFSNCERGVLITGGGIGIVSHCDFLDCGYGITIRSTGTESYSKLTYNSIFRPRVLGIDFRGNLDQFASLIQYNKIVTSGMNNPDFIAGIRILSTPSFEDQFVKIADNTISISNGGVGIDLDGVAYTEVKGINKIIIQSGKAYKGVTLHNKSNSCFVTGVSTIGPDYFYNTNTRNKIGMQLWESENNIISCNYFKGAGVALNAIENCSGTVFQHNEFAGGADGLTMGSEGGLATIIDDQFATGNVWSGNHTHYDAVNYNPSCYGKFYIYPQDKLPYYDNKYWPNKGLIPSPGDFLNPYDPAASTPLTDCGTGYVQSIKLTGIQLKIVNEDYENLPSTDYFKWSSKWLLFDKIKAVPEIQNIAEVSDFLSREKQNTEYAIWKIASEFQEASSMESNDEEILRASEEKEVVYDQLATLIQQWNAAPDNKSLIEEINTIIKSTNEKDQIINDNIAKSEARFAIKINSLREKLASIYTSNEMDKNMKTVLDIRMSMALDVNACLTEESIIILNGIADQCHLIAGDAVYVAKNLLKSIGIEVAEDYDICNPNLNNNTADEVNLQATANVYPNPGSTSLEIDLKSDLNNSALLTITDILGNEKLSKSINAGHNTINTSELANGLYLVIVENKDGSTSTTKWIKN